ncbi:hypothetical protein BBO99_00006470 [Phytophthora kernoviae]|uniref:PDZ domain-containing protein n=2 Tax=Phytophthora kernoviae TaxID=325452 RepID=A0A421FFA6_9STRA|nr:hypothetical protein G195_007503 [Phytophthora kernoviae 00238/432]KAG2522363.1 hypothetical protein JM18_006182 [Phytophthora kernoviae]KAG2527835.1 hypothetical protein JM16_003002 [Phytophthora kernoviae]RLN43970.1 hypothetical protein BBI17_003355 [Phytophthora kernoviae]RLN77787.1 hypothetical protein BBO99_00006470 [Phytophthora kernoviae]
MRVLVCKNDGCLEFEPAELHQFEHWNDVKMGLADALYSEEELFAVASPKDIALYTFPDGSTVNGNDEANVETLLLPDSKWVLDIFGSPFRQRSDLTLQTDHAIRGVRRGMTTASHPLETCTLPLTAACPSAISNQGPRILYEGVYHLNLDEMKRGFVQAVRLWFSFDCEQTISVTKVNGALGLKPLRQQDGWIVVQALPGSPCFDAGMRRDEVFLTHVNGVDVSPHSFPAVGTGTLSQQTQQLQQNHKTGQL